jgi:hypothetical protein
LNADRNGKFRSFFLFHSRWTRSLANFQFSSDHLTDSLSPKRRKSKNLGHNGSRAAKAGEPKHKLGYKMQTKPPEGALMAWNRRGYYRRSHWVDGRTVTEYVGAGEVGERAAQLDAVERECLAVRQVAERIEREKHAAHDALLEEFCKLVDQLAHAALLAAGYHRHDRGKWRKRRGHRNESPEAPAIPHLKIDQEQYNSAGPLTGAGNEAGAPPSTPT